MQMGTGISMWKTAIISLRFFAVRYAGLTTMCGDGVASPPMRVSAPWATAWSEHWLLPGFIIKQGFHCRLWEVGIFKTLQRACSRGMTQPTMASWGAKMVRSNVSSSYLVLCCPLKMISMQVGRNGRLGCGEQEQRRDSDPWDFHWANLPWSVHSMLKF